MKKTWADELYEDIIGMLDRNGIRDAERRVEIAQHLLKRVVKYRETPIESQNQPKFPIAAPTLTKEDYAELYCSLLDRYYELRNDYVHAVIANNKIEKAAKKEILKDMYELLEVAEADEITICCEDIENIAERYGIKKEELQ